MLKPQSVSLVLICALSLISHYAWGATSNSQYPNADEEFKQFLAFHIGMPQQEFRYAIPRNWSASNAMYSKKQNRNLIEEYDEGYFEYERNPRGTLEPMFTFRFWDSKLTESTALLFRKSESGNAEIRKLTSEVIELVSEIFGKPTETKSSSLSVWSSWARWQKNDVEVLVRAAEWDATKPSSTIGQVELRLQSLKRYSALQEFTSRRKDSVHTGSFVTQVLCTKVLKSGNKLEIALSTDTRSLTKEQAQLVGTAKKKGFEASQYKCQVHLDDRKSQEKSYDRTFQQKRILKTYLFFEDMDGFANTILFVNTKGKVEDQFCEVIKNSLPAANARCVSGTALFYIDE